ncbi:OLC1v1029414C1 [Oldenlandia corymbosa var. corymbosa]|uniref:OLC1v1029414C1 n=1 Tax=Oldenlandia corymbosa var. corymbosa TaxID=529605 RepID=A0AAV1CEB3_OLDCO|nr:OLC1v1029414C1 [Oldenlandia corymbosa var. corymbosa]
MATSSSKHPISPQFTPIEEGNEDEEMSRSSFRATTPNDSAEGRHHHPTPLHQQNRGISSSSSSSKKKGHSSNGHVVGREDDKGVSCNKCRPNSKVVDNNGNVHRQSLASPNGIFKSIFSGLAKKSPRSASDTDSVSLPTEEQWKLAAAELSHKLIQATRKRDEAILEASRLKYAMAELEKKLNKLEIYCHNLKSGLEVCSSNNNGANGNNDNRAGSNSKLNNHHLNYQFVRVGHDQGKVIEHFLVSVSEARSSVRLLARALTLQLGQMGGKVYDRISLLLQPYEIKVSFSKNPRGLVLYLEALLNKAFYEDFESIGFQKSSSNSILNPIDRCEANFVSFNRLRGLTWDEVLNKGTKHFSEDFSKFCDRKMSEIVAMLGWNRAWPEQLLQSFFGASKALWLVHLLAHSVHPSLPIFRVDKGTSFDSIYMEDMGGDNKAQKLVPTIVRIMVTPGFYVYDNVVKCKVLSRYYNSNTNVKGVLASPS